MSMSVQLLGISPNCQIRRSDVFPAGFQPNRGKMGHFGVIDLPVILTQPRIPLDFTANRVKNANAASEQTQDRHCSGYLFRLLNEHRVVLEELRNKHHRSPTKEMQIPLENHSWEEGIAFSLGCQPHPSLLLSAPGAEAQPEDPLTHAKEWFVGARRAWQTQGREKVSPGSRI